MTSVAAAVSEDAAGAGGLSSPMPGGESPSEASGRGVGGGSTTTKTTDESSRAVREVATADDGSGRAPSASVLNSFTTENGAAKRGERSGASPVVRGAVSETIAAGGKTVHGPAEKVAAARKAAAAILKQKREFVLRERKKREERATQAAAKSAARAAAAVASAYVSTFTTGKAASAAAAKKHSTMAVGSSSLSAPSSFRSQTAGMFAVEVETDGGSPSVPYSSPSYRKGQMSSPSSSSRKAAASLSTAMDDAKRGAVGTRSAPQARSPAQHQPPGGGDAPHGGAPYASPTQQHAPYYPPPQQHHHAYPPPPHGGHPPYGGYVPGGYIPTGYSQPAMPPYSRPQPPPPPQYEQHLPPPPSHLGSPYGQAHAQYSGGSPHRHHQHSPYAVPGGHGGPSPYHAQHTRHYQHHPPAASAGGTPAAERASPPAANSKRPRPTSPRGAKSPSPHRTPGTAKGSGSVASGAGAPPTKKKRQRENGAKAAVATAARSSGAEAVLAAKAIAVGAAETTTSSTATGSVAKVVPTAMVTSKGSDPPEVRKFTNLIRGVPESDFTQYQLEGMPVAFAFRPEDADGPAKAAALEAQESWNAKWRAAGLVFGEKRGRGGAAKKPKTKPKPKAKPSGGGGGSEQRSKRPAARAVEMFDGPAPDIGPGWTMKRYKRMGGAGVGREDRYWYSPREKLKFRSKPAIMRFKEALDTLGPGGDEKVALRMVNG